MLDILKVSEEELEFITGIGDTKKGGILVMPSKSEVNELI